MLSSVSNSSSAMSMMSTNALQRHPPSQGQDAFKLSDTDGDGLVSKSELETLASGIEEVTGSSINVDDAISSFDANQDGGLSGEELLEMLTSMGFSPPEMTASEDGESSAMAPPPPPPPSSEQASSAYSENTGDDMLAQLIELLESQENSDTNTYSPINVTS